MFYPCFHIGFITRYAARRDVICRLSRCNICPFTLQLTAFCIANSRVIVKNACIKCHNVTVRRNPLAFTALRVTSSRRLMSPPSRSALRRDIGESASMITVTV